MNATDENTVVIEFGGRRYSVISHLFECISSNSEGSVILNMYDKLYPTQKVSLEVLEEKR